MDKTHIQNNDCIPHTSSPQYEGIYKFFQVGGIILTPLWFVQSWKNFSEEKLDIQLMDSQGHSKVKIIVTY